MLKEIKYRIFYLHLESGILFTVVYKDKSYVQLQSSQGFIYIGHPNTFFDQFEEYE